MEYTHHLTTEPAPSTMQTKNNENRAKKGEGWKSIVSTIAVLLLAPLFALILILFVFQSYQVDGSSMETTLQNNDRLIVWKVPRTLARITKHRYIPNRGDVVVFTEPSLVDFGQSPNKQLIKRVIGLPKEHIRIQDGEVTVINSQHPDGFQPDIDLPYGSVIQTTPGIVDLVVPDDSLYVMGDNRTGSLDSRSFGPIKADHIVGKLVMRFYPFDKFKRF